MLPPLVAAVQHELAEARIALPVHDLDCVTDTRANQQYKADHD
jgi:hypothetical protein